jgi:hypothetical protein
MLRHCGGISLASVARIERQRNPGRAAGPFPDFVSTYALCASAYSNPPKLAARA